MPPPRVPPLARFGTLLLSLGLLADLALHALARDPQPGHLLTYHLDWTVFLFAHTIAEVLDLVAFILVFVGAVQPVLGRAATRAAHA